MLKKQLLCVSRLHFTNFYHQFQDAVKRAEILSQRQKQAYTRATLYQVLFDEIRNDVSKVFKQAEQKLKATEAEAEMWEGKRPPTTAAEPETTGDTFNLDQALAELKDDVLGRDRK